MSIKISLFLFSWILLLSTMSHAQKSELQLIQFADGFNRPVDIKHCSDDRIFVVEQNGQIIILDKNGNKRLTPFLNIDSIVNSNGNEQGLIGLAFSPNYKNDGYFFVNFTSGASAGYTVVARYSVDPNDSNLALANSKKVLYQLTQPATNHNGGNMMFGDDGFLYIAQGDGGGGNFSQDQNSFHSKILRINPFQGNPYSIPSDNPFIGQPTIVDEMWVSGLRNPWRCSFDKLTGDLWIADVGQNNFEEINFQAVASAGGENYGWRCYEGFSPYITTGCGPSTDYVYPVYVYDHSFGCSVTGGYVYRGAQYENMFGKYFFTDACSGNIWSLLRNGTSFDPDTLGSFLSTNFVTFGEDTDGELFLGGFSMSQANSGKVWRVTDTSSCKPVAFFSFEDTLITSNDSLLLMALKGSGLKYQWKRNGIALPSDTMPEYLAKTSGLYTVEVTKGNCVSISKPTLVKINPLVSVENNFNDLFKIYPNPGKGQFTLLLNGPANEKISFFIYNNLGQQVYAANVGNSINQSITLPNAQTGIYTVEVITSSFKTVRKVIVE